MGHKMSFSSIQFSTGQFRFASLHLQFFRMRTILLLVSQVISIVYEFGYCMLILRVSGGNFNVGLSWVELFRMRNLSWSNFLILVYIG